MRTRLLTFISIAVISLSCGQLSVNAEDKPTPADIEKSFKKGLMAAEQGSWDVALKYFNEVLQADQFYFPGYFNVGLVHEKTGNELAAIAWFQAYLHYVPDAPDRAQVEDEIARLELALETKIGKIVAQAEEAARALPEKTPREFDDGETYDAHPQDDGIAAVCFNLGSIGDMALAEKFVARHYPNETFEKMNGIKAHYAEVLARSGDCDGALKLARSLNGTSKDDAFFFAAEGLYKKGDLGGAVKALANIGVNDGAGDLMVEIIAELGERKRADEAVTLYGKITKNLLTRYDTLPVVAAALAKSGRQNEAVELIKKDEAQAGDIADIRFDRLLRCAQAYLAAGDMPNARRVADGLKPVSPRHDLDFIWKDLAVLYYQVGNKEKYDEYAQKVTEPDRKNELIVGIVRGARGDEDPVVLEKMIAGLHSSGISTERMFAESYGDVAWQYARKGDPAAVDRLRKALDERTEARWITTGAFYVTLALHALKEGNAPAAETFIAKLGNDSFEMGKVLQCKMNESVRKGRPADALRILLDERKSWDGIFKDNWFLREALRAAREARAAGDVKAVRIFADAAATYAQEKDLATQFGSIAALYETADDAKLAAQFRARVRDSSWADLARSFEKGDTANPAAYFEKIKDKTPEDMPHAIAWLAVLYADGLRKIQQKAKESR